MIKQLSVFMENRAGRLHKLTEVLGNAGIDLLVLSIADTADFGIVRFITTDNDRAVAELRAAGFTVSVNSLIGVEVSDKPAGLAEVMSLLTENHISVGYLYSFARTEHKTAIILFRVDDAEATAEYLKENGIKVIDQI